MIPIYMKCLCDLRKNNNLSLQYVADIWGTSQTTYARYERGVNELPIRQPISLCSLYNVSADYLSNLRVDRKRIHGIAKLR